VFPPKMNLQFCQRSGAIAMRSDDQSGTFETNRSCLDSDPVRVSQDRRDV
jgi:hypothetical protein